MPGITATQGPWAHKRPAAGALAALGCALSLSLGACNGRGQDAGIAEERSPEAAAQDMAETLAQDVVAAAAQPVKVLRGAWRAALQSPGGPLTFGLELEPTEDGALRAVLINGEERRPVGRLNQIPGGLVFDLPPYRSRMVCEVKGQGRSLVGRWQRDLGAGFTDVMAFAATAGSDTPEVEAPDPAKVAAVSGRWRVNFAADDEVSVGLFDVQPDGTASGTFLTTLGDYRYLAGRFDGETLLLSCFDGAHAFLFSARLEGETLTGDFWSRDSYHDTWTAAKDPDAALPDDFALTSWTGAPALSELSFPDMDGETRSLSDPAFGGKARLLVVFGTWCPNCNDLTEYLVQLKEQYEGLSVLGLAFELGSDQETHARAVRDYMAHHGADYPVLLGGSSDKQEASRALPVLDRLRAYPTTVFMDEEGNVSAVHTGFSGPATGERHGALKERFESTIESLLAESEGQ